MFHEVMQDETRLSGKNNVQGQVFIECVLESDLCGVKKVRKALWEQSLTTLVEYFTETTIRKWHLNDIGVNFQP